MLVVQFAHGREHWHASPQRGHVKLSLAGEAPPLGGFGLLANYENGDVTTLKAQIAKGRIYLLSSTTINTYMLYVGQKKTMRDSLKHKICTSQLPISTSIRRRNDRRYWHFTRTGPAWRHNLTVRAETSHKLTKRDAGDAFIPLWTK